jgi:hypothetical protein
MQDRSKIIKRKKLLEELNFPPKVTILPIQTIE